jgi:hypothetical protein
MSITLSGTVAAKGANLLMQATGDAGPEGLLKFMFSVPGEGGLTFCIGPKLNSAGEGTYLYTVSASTGAPQLALVDAGFFKKNLLAVVNYEAVELPFAVTIE